MSENIPNGSRVEDILQSIVDDDPYTQEPQSRVEDLLLQVKEVIEEGGGGGGGSTVSITPTLETGTKIAEYEIDGVEGVLYAPNGGSGSSFFVVTLGSLDPETNKYSVDRTKAELEYAVSENMTIALKTDADAPYLYPMTEKLSNTVLSFEIPSAANSPKRSGADHEVFFRYLVMWDPSGAYAVHSSSSDRKVFTRANNHTLVAGDTVVRSIFDSGFFTSYPKARIDIYSSIFGVNPTNVELNNDVVVVTFPAQQSDMDVIVEVNY